MPNDSKYVRLYPERAVAPVREALRQLIAEGIPLGESRIIGIAMEALDKLDRLAFPLDEPLFLLRGQDKLAPATVRHYADQIVLMEGAFGEPGQAASAIEHIRDFADAMERWQPRKLPD